jgi:hypothetical protein
MDSVSGSFFLPGYRNHHERGQPPGSVRSYFWSDDTDKNRTRPSTTALPINAPTFNLFFAFANRRGTCPYSH